MKFKIFLILFIIALGILSYFAYPIVKNRYFKNMAKNEEQKSQTNTIMNNGTQLNSTTGENNTDTDNSSTMDNDIRDTTDESGDNANITAKDCDNECLNFKNNENDLKYCQNICGLSLANDSDNCDSKMGSDKDYCFKNQAVSKTDLAICDSITDTKIKSSCKNRVTEDLLEQQQ
jgi:hypothetical protein